MQESKINNFGMSITNCCKKMVEEAKALDTEVFLEFNDVKIVAHKDSDPRQLEAEYFRKMNHKIAEYEKSEEYQSEKLKSQNLNRLVQSKLDDQMTKLESLDFANHKQVLQWLCDIQDYTDTVNVKVPVATIVSIFEENGYYPNVNTGDNLRPDDASNVAHYIVGQCLDCLNNMGAIHGIVHRFTKEWNEKFS